MSCLPVRTAEIEEIEELEAHSYNEAMYRWLNGNVFRMQVTLDRNTLTLNQAACSRFQNCRYVRVGLDPEELKLAIQPVSREEMEQGRAELGQLQKLSFGKGYGRIANRKVMEEIERMTGRSCRKDKYACVWKEAEGFLEADLSCLEVEE